MSTEQNVQPVKDFFAAAFGGDREAMLTLVAEDIEWIIPGEDWPLAGTHRGHAGLTDLLKTESETMEMSVSEPGNSWRRETGSWSSVRQGEGQGHEQAVRGRLDLCHHVRDGKLTSIREYVDTQALARAAEVDTSGPA